MKKAKKETVKDLTARMREYGWDMQLRAPAIGSFLRCMADEIDEALGREKSKIEADVMEQCLLGDAARLSIKPAFDKAEFDQAVSGPSAWDAVEDPVAEIRKMRGDKEASHE